MVLGEVCLLTDDVIRLARFYKELLGVENGSDDPVHQIILTGEPALAIYNDGSEKKNASQNICLAFTVEDVDKEYARLLTMGVEIIEKPAWRPWGARNMSFRDPDGNTVYFRNVPK